MQNKIEGIRRYDVGVDANGFYPVSVEQIIRFFDPVEPWRGGCVHKIRPSVIHLMRGQVFELDGKKIFTFGGASSHDIDGGILEPDDPDYKKKKRELDKGWKPYRINHLSWWKEELPSEAEMIAGRENLMKQGKLVCDQKQQ